PSAFFSSLFHHFQLSNRKLKKLCVLLFRCWREAGFFGRSGSGLNPEAEKSMKDLSAFSSANDSFPDGPMSARLNVPQTSQVVQS
ncbi:MAG TPA: hypothetical protein VNQ14_00115, partial [Woeseiaceae bacterium]|nr:hypothetical protein [Woeseiaceae bacterium]